VLLWERERKVATFETGNVGLNVSGIGSSMFKKNKKEPDKVFTEDDASAEITEDAQPAVIESDKGFVEDFTVPWDLSFQYTMNARRTRFSVMEAEGFAIQDSIAFTQSLQLNGSFELFGRVKFRVNSGYDFQLEEFTPTVINMVVDLNCWEFSARVIPFGNRRSYNLSLYIKSSLLKDLKLERNQNLGPDDNFFR
jgi:hypothetical protein